MSYRKTYLAYLYSENKLIDNLPMMLYVGEPVRCKIRIIEDLDIEAPEKERIWYDTEVVPNIVGDKYDK